MRIGISTAITSFNYASATTAPLEPDQEIVALFENGEVGAWYDPSDSTTVFQDAAGTTAAAVGDPVGLILDKSQGLATSNSGTAASSYTNYGWDVLTPDGTGGFTATKSTAGGNDYANTQETLDIVAGEVYRVTFTVTASTLTTFECSFGSTTNARSNNATFSGTGTKTAYLTVSTTQIGAQFRIHTTYTGSITVTGASWERVAGNHATQTTSAARPVLQIQGGTPSSFGSDLITNGTFDVDANWVKSSATISGGVATLNSYIQQTSIGMVQGKYYRVTLDIVSLTAPGVRVYVGTTAGSVPESYQDFTSTGTKVAVRIRGSTGDFVRIGLTGSGTAVVDNVVVQQVTAWTGGEYYLDFDGVDDFIQTATFASGLAQPNTLSYAFKQDTTTGYQSLSDSNGAPSGRHIFRSNGTTYEMYAGTVADTGVAVSTASTVAVAHFNSVSSSARFNATATSAFDVGATQGWQSLRMGASKDTNIYLDGRIYSFVGVNRTLTAGEITDLETYLASKSGVTLSAGDGGDGDKGG